jgi:formylglycine-generating enzyme required for sulfatase activity
MQKSLVVCLLAAIAAFAADARGVTIDWTPVGNPGNTNDPADGDSFTSGIQNFGAVPYAYNIDKYDVTTSQYVEFLNAKAGRPAACGAPPAVLAEKFG